MRTYDKNFLLTLFLLIICSSEKAGADELKVNFRNGSSLVFSLPSDKTGAKTFGSGWKSAIFVTASGRQIPIFPVKNFSSGDDFLFEKVYAPKISPSGKYVAFFVLRSGTVDPGPDGKAEVSSRQYCPVLNAVSGCIVSMHTGELCGGNWAKNTDQWVVPGYKYDSTSAMLRNNANNVNDLWSQFKLSRTIVTSSNLRDFVEDNFGIANMMACEPPSVENRDAYLSIADKMRKEGDIDDANFVDEKLEVGNEN